MKYLFLFLLLSTTVFSQNFHYAVDEKSGTATPDTTAPTNPINLVVSNITQTTAYLIWTASTDDVGVVDYRVYNNDTLLFDHTDASKTSFTLTDLNPSTNYSLTIRAVDAAGNESENSNTKLFITRENIASITRFIVIGASVIKNSFVQNTTLSLINTVYPSETVEFYNEALNGATSTAMVGYIDEIMDKYSYDSNKNTYVMVHIGGNDVTRTRPYSTATEGEKTTLTNNLTYILNAIEAKGFTPILATISFRDYDDTTHANEENGSLPYNENIIKPLILSRTPEFSYNDGTSFFQTYEVFYNNYETYLNSDNVHPTGAGGNALRNHFVSTICKYIFEGVPPTKINKNSIFQSSQNLIGEIAALEDTYYLPISEKANLQAALNTYNKVRLGKGDYSGVTITMSGDMKLYGHPSVTKVPAITLNNCNGLIMESIKPGGITIPSGQTVKNSKFITIADSYIKSTGGIVENNTFLDMSKTRLHLDMSSSGYIRNNKIIRYWVHAYSDQLILKGNDATPSYGNSMVFSQFLTPGGNTMDIDNLQDFRMAGLDAETWNFSNKGTRAALYMRNMGNVKIAVPSGGHKGVYKTPVFDIEADNLFMIGKKMEQNSGYPSIARANTNVFMIKSNGDPYNLESGTGFDFRAYFDSNNIIYNAVSNIVSLITGDDKTTKLTKMILDEQLTPWARPIFETLPDPTGSGWATIRTGKTDSTSYIQGLINANGIAELDEGIYYISASLNISNGQGIVGKGTGKTAIVGLTDDFDLVTMKGTDTKPFTLAHMTLQGGRSGLRILPLTSTYYQPSACRLKYLVFRNQTNGIHVGRIFGLDNNFLDHVSFVNCDTGFFLDSDPSYKGGETTTMTYYDKVVFYQSQFINNNKGVKAYSQRASNLNAWIDSKFENNRIAADLTNHNYPFFANCDFTAQTGSYVIKGNSHLGLYSCNFYGNSSSNIISSNSLYIEGSNFLDNAPVFTSGSTEGYILNSTFAGDIGDFTQGMIINSNMKRNPELNRLMVKVLSGVPTTLLDAAPNPYPQLLVSH